VAVKRANFIKELRRFRTVGLDSSIFIYHLEDVEPYSDLTEAAFAAFGEGTPVAVLSTLSVTELLVQPFAARQPDRISAFERFILTLPNTTLVPASYAIAKNAARLRATYRLRTPDALLVATALEAKADAFLTNDANLRKLKAEGIAIVVLETYV